MNNRDNPSNRNTLTPEIILKAYTTGIFPMAEHRRDPELFWVDPKMRGILPLDGFHVPRSLKRRIRQNPYEMRYDYDFEAVIDACAKSTSDRQETWINREIIGLYTELFYMGYVHSVECWSKGILVGGLYGLSMRGVFFGESMFSRERDASKIALVYLVARLIFGHFVLLDTQFVTRHLKQFGALEIPREKYHELLEDALSIDAKFYREVPVEDEEEALSRLLQSRTHTS